MKPSIQIRSAQPDDAAAMVEIYSPFVRHSSVSFEIEVPSPEAFWQRVVEVQREAPWLVFEKNGLVVGYAYAGRHRARHAYQWTREVSAYVREGYRHHGVGSALYITLIELLKWQGFTNTLAGITLPNEVSVRFHEKMGFTPVGTYHRVGFKFGQFHDVGWWEQALSLQEAGPILPVADLEGGEGWKRAVTRGLQRLNLPGNISENEE